MSDEMPHDDDLRELYRKLPADEPRAEIDAAILAAARGRLARDSRTSLMRRIRWAVPLAAAAGVVLTFALMRLAPERRVQGIEESARTPIATRNEPTTPPAAGFGASPEGSLTAAGRTAKEEDAPGLADADPASSRDEAAPAAPPPSALSGTAAPPPRRQAGRAEQGEVLAEAGNPADTSQKAATGTDAAPHEGRAGAGTPDVASQPGAASPPLATDVPGDAASVAACEAEPEDPAVAAARSRTESIAAAAAEVEWKRWPFGLEPWLDAAEACRRLSAASSAPCEFRGEVAVVEPPLPVNVDAGLHRGRPVSLITLVRRGGRLATVEVRFTDNPVRQMFVSPEPAP